MAPEEVGNDKRRETYKKKYRKEHSQEIKEYNAKWYKLNAESRKAGSKKWTLANRSRYNELRKIRRERDGRSRDYETSEKGKAANKRFRKQHRKYWKSVFDSVKQHYGCCNPLCECQSDLPSCCLDFHHIDRKEKKCCVAASCGKAGIKEMRKCTVLCAICHRKETYGLLDASSFQKCQIDDNGIVVMTINNHYGEVSRISGDTA